MDRRGQCTTPEQKFKILREAFICAMLAFHTSGKTEGDAEMQAAKYFEHRHHFRCRPGSRADRRLLRHRPSAGAVYEKHADPPHADFQQWKRMIHCLTPEQRARLLAELQAEGFGARR